MRLKAAITTVSLAAILAACGGASATPTPVPATPAPASAAPSEPASEASEAPGETEENESGEGTPPAGTLAPGASVAALVKVSANTATTDELVAALTAAGVPNAAKWADEIEEYRPYDASDTALSKLRSELEKYNPGEDVLAAILSVLQP